MRYSKMVDLYSKAARFVVWSRDPGINIYKFHKLERLQRCSTYAVNPPAIIY
jgi:hypothetical protein